MSGEKFRGQDYGKLRKHHRELGVPWTDPLFPATDNSIGLNRIKELSRKVEWKRPRDITDNPKLFVDGLSQHDAHQGKLGNCWFVAACSVLAGSKPLWERVIPDHKDQEWSTESEYSGVFRFRFWRFGKWIEVVVDDLLPTMDGQLIFIHSAENNEFWGALLEKAYAKLHGSYESLDGGNLSDALVDFTSGVSEVVDVAAGGYLTDDLEKKKSLFKMMASEIEDHALMCCAIKANNASEMEEKTDLGLVKGHAYGITAVRKVPIGGAGLVSFFKGREKLFLVRLQNPWGAKEWSGPFSDTSPEWSTISEKEREKLGLTFNDDGEFWMPFDDFLHQFTEISICRILNTSLFSLSKTWNESQVFGTWIKAPGANNRAGGCLNNRDSFIYNPQYRFDIEKEEDEVIVQLSQECAKDEMLVIGFIIFRVESNRKFRVHKITSDLTDHASDYIKTKHIFLKQTLEKGRYVLIPTTFKEEETGNFLLRVFTDENCNLKELKQDEPKNSWWQCCAKEPAMLTKITVKEATGLEGQDTFGKADPYCYIKCEGQKVRSEVVSNTQSPTFKSASAIFYRKDPEKPIKVQIWNKNLVKDGFMGQALLLAEAGPSDSGPQTCLKELVGKGSKKNEVMKGTITLDIETYTDLSAL